MFLIVTACVTVFLSFLPLYCIFFTVAHRRINRSCCRLIVTVVIIVWFWCRRWCRTNVITSTTVVFGTTYNQNQNRLSSRNTNRNIRIRIFFFFFDSARQVLDNIFLNNYLRFRWVYRVFYYIFIIRCR